MKSEGGKECVEMEMEMERGREGTERGFSLQDYVYLIYLYGVEIWREHELSFDLC